MVFECKNSFGLKEDVESVVVRVQCPPPTVISCGQGRPAALLPAITICNQGLYIPTRFTLFTFNHNGSGGAVMGGAAIIDLDVSNNVFGSGGAVAAGISDVTDIASEEGLAGAVLTGDGDIFLVTSEEGSAGAALAGDGETSFTYNPITIPSPIIQQTEADYLGGGSNGSFIGGVTYVPTEIVTMTNGLVVVMDVVNIGEGSGALAFTVITSGTGLGVGATYSQVSTTGIGIGFTMTTGANNEGFHGARVGGSGPNQLVDIVEVGGGIVIAGDSPVEASSDRFGTGGIVGGGDTVGQFNYNPKSIEAPIILQTQDDYIGGEIRGTFVGGSGHAVSDILTLTKGATLGVDSESSGSVTEFTILSSGAGLGTLAPFYSQTSTTGSGTGFSLITSNLNEGLNGANIGGAGPESVTACPVCNGNQGSGGTADVQYVANPPSGLGSIEGAGVADESVS